VPRRLVIGLALGVAGSTAITAGAQARSLRPDRAFGNGRGFVLTRMRGARAFVNGAAVLPGGSIVVAGQLAPFHGGPTGDLQVFVARYLPDGRLDRRFASGGIFRTRLPNRDGPFNATAVARDRSGRLVVAGGYGQGSMLALRLTAAGRLDRTFGRRRSGIATVAVGGIANSLALLPRGGILLGGSNANVMGRPMVVVRLSPAGRVDRSFGRRGIAQLLFWNPRSASSSGVVGLAATHDGGVIGGGHIDYIGGTAPGQSGYGEAGVFRLTSNGRLAHRFGRGGHVMVGFRNPNGTFGAWFPCAMTVAGTGRVTITGDGSLGSGNQILTARFTAGGRLDRTFGGRGTGRSVIPGLFDSSNPVCGASLGTAGDLTVGVNRTLARLRPNGRRDLSFAHGGLFRIANPRGASIEPVVRSAPGRIVVAGNAGSAAWVARYVLR